MVSSIDDRALATSGLSMLATIEQSIRDADPWAFPVLPRIVRRAIRHELDLPTLGTRVPHRKSCIISGPRARQIVMPDELGIEPTVPIPEMIMLLARPEEHVLEGMSAEALCEHYRRLHVHARVHVALARRQQVGRLDERAVRNRIARIGFAAFDEIRAVLRQESFLLPSATQTAVYVEFAAVFVELRYFAPEVLASYFPSLDDFGRVEAVLAEDVDADNILRMTSELATSALGEVPEQAPPPPARIVAERPRSERALNRVQALAAGAAAKGNDVRAAILHTRAADAEQSGGQAPSAELAAEDIERLVQRLRSALELEDDAVDALREHLTALLMQSAYGFWNPDARLLYDLQKVCLAAERATYVIDLGAWLRSLGRQPLKRPLQAQREVLMSKHLQAAISRLPKVQLAAGQREHFSVMLRRAAAAAEECLRERLRPVLHEVLLGVGFHPRNIPEQVALDKLVEELLDAVAERGFVGMGDLRDAIARNNLKLDDVADPLELIVGDRLLRADSRLADALDGVYRRGAFYLRWLQRLSSCAFGTRPGRFFTLYAAIPFGGAFVILAGLDHLIHAIEGFVAHSTAVNANLAPTPFEVAPAEHVVAQGRLANPYLIVLVGTFLLGLMHDPQFRGLVWSGLRTLGRGLRGLFIELPKWIARVTFINALLRSAPVTFFRKRLLTALLLTLLVSRGLPLLGLFQAPGLGVTTLIFVMFAVLLNSRAGRDIEELTAERLQLTWHRIRVRVLVALFDLVMDSFKRVLEWIERILYEVDEWFRFKSGESGLMLGIKAVLGLFWSVIRFFLRFFVTVLIEPQINPIKHFPVVTVSHKVILPLGIPLRESLVPVFGTGWANMIAGTTVFLVPGVFGFLVWELRGNWRLYAVNRHRELKPVVVGHHGETLIRLMKLGLHSGTVPRLFSKLRRAARKASPTYRLRELMGYYAKLHRLEVDVRRLFEREFLSFLQESSAFRGVWVEIDAIEIGTNSLRVEFAAPEVGPDSLWITFEEQSGRMVAGISQPGWSTSLTADQRAALAGLIVGLYRICGVELVREQIMGCLSPSVMPYDVTEAGLVSLPGSGRDAEIVYDLNEFPTIEPRELGTTRRLAEPVAAERLVFGRTKTRWNDWVAAWRLEAAGRFPDLPPLRPESVTFGAPRPVVAGR